MTGAESHLPRIRLAILRGPAGRVLIILSLINFINYVDRFVATSLFPLLKKEFVLSDFELGLLVPAFLVIHAVFSIPAALLANRWLKSRLIAIGIAIWSTATALSALAENYTQLFIFRALIGVGEATYAPAATALISAYFIQRDRAKAMGIFNLGLLVGGAVGMFAGTQIGGYVGWREAFLVVGVPGFVLAVFAWRLKEGPPGAEVQNVPLRRADIADLFRIRTLRYVFVGGMLITFCVGGIVAFFTEYVFVRFGADGAQMTLEEIRKLPPEVLAKLGVPAAIAALIGSVVGVPTGAALGDRWFARNPAGRLNVIAAGFLIGIPLAVIGQFIEIQWLFFCVFTIGISFFVWYMGPIFAVLHDVVRPNQRAMVIALFIFAIHMGGDAISPPIIGLVSDATRSLRTAFWVPLGVGLIGAFIIYLGGRHVAADMKRAAAS
ncbi:MAG: MFS transporter [Deltaproteobacteria bacterium]|nr:MFS transporter [Deltaproteobacteria bacterium]